MIFSRVRAIKSPSKIDPKLKLEAMKRNKKDFNAEKLGLGRSYADLRGTLGVP